MAVVDLGKGTTVVVDNELAVELDFDRQSSLGFELQISILLSCLVSSSTSRELPIDLDLDRLQQPVVQREELHLEEREEENEMMVREHLSCE